MSTSLGIEQKDSPSYVGSSPNSHASHITEGATVGVDKRPREDMLDPSMTRDESPKKIKRTIPSSVVPPFTGLDKFSEFLEKLAKKYVPRVPIPL